MLTMYFHFGFILADRHGAMLYLLFSLASPLTVAVTVCILLLAVAVGVDTGSFGPDEPTPTSSVGESHRASLQTATDGGETMVCVSLSRANRKHMAFHGRPGGFVEADPPSVSGTTALRHATASIQHITAEQSRAEHPCCA